jgi:glutamate/tyrosine decarboxylase-like PLP-dependent enzyme
MTWHTWLWMAMHVDSCMGMTIAMMARAPRARRKGWGLNW